METQDHLDAHGLFAHVGWMSSWSSWLLPAHSHRVSNGVLGAAVVVLCACISSGTAQSEAVPLRDPQFVSVRGLANPRPAQSAQTPAADGCKITRSKRLYVGFSDGMTLDDFEVAAYQAEHMLGFLKHRLCTLAPAVDPSGALPAALAQGSLEMFELKFTHDDATAAEVALQAPGREGNGADSAAFHVLVTQQKSGWRAVSVDAR